MSVPHSSLSCCSRVFIDRISDSMRRGRQAQLFTGEPGLFNPAWFLSAYHASLPRGGGEKINSEMDASVKAAIAEHCAGFPLTHANKEAFDRRIREEIERITRLVKERSPTTFWSEGRSQKVINLLLKFSCAAFHCGLPAFAKFQKENSGIGEITPLLHAPVDRATMTWAARGEGAPAFLKNPDKVPSWWRDLTLDQYEQLQVHLGRLADAKGISRIHFEMLYIW